MSTRGKAEVPVCATCDGLGEWDEGPLPGHSTQISPEYRQVTCPDCNGRGYRLTKAGGQSPNAPRKTIAETGSSFPLGENKATHGALSLRYHAGNPDLCRIPELNFREMPECEGGGYALRREQAEPIVHAVNTLPEVTRHLADMTSRFEQAALALGSDVEMVVLATKDARAVLKAAKGEV